MSAQVRAAAPGERLRDRFLCLEWPRLEVDLDAQGCAIAPGLLTRTECDGLAALYARDDRFRSRVVMDRHGVSRVHSGQRHTLGIIFHDAT